MITIFILISYFFSDCIKKNRMGIIFKDFCIKKHPAFKTFNDRVFVWYGYFNKV